MALPEAVPTAEIQLDRPRKLAFTLGAMKRIRQVLGRELGDEGGSITDDIGGILWAMLVKEDRGDITPDDIDDMLTPGDGMRPGNLDEAIRVFNQLMGVSVAEGKGQELPAVEAQT